MSEEQKDKWLLALKGYEGETLREKVIDYLLLRILWMQKMHLPEQEKLLKQNNYLKIILLKKKRNN